MHFSSTSRTVTTAAVVMTASHLLRLGSSSGGCFGEYECLLGSQDVGAAIGFSRELFTREFVVHRVASELCMRSATHARLHRGHVVVSVDGVAVRSLSSCQFDAIWDSLGADSELDDRPHEGVDGRQREGWRVRFRDRKRAELAVDMHKERVHFVRVRSLVPGGSVSDSDGGQDELDAELCRINEHLWRFELDAAHSRVHALPCAADPLVHVLSLELEIMRAFASHDSLEVKKARAAASETVAWLDRLADLPSLSHCCRLLAKTALAETLLMRGLVEALTCALSPNALLSVAGKVAVLAACARRSARLYCELQRLLRDELEPTGGGTQCGPSQLDRTTGEELKARVCFGIAVLRLCGSLARSSSPFEWFSSALLPALDDSDCGVRDDPARTIQTSLRELFACTQATATPGGSRSRWCQWAELLLLLVGPSAIDTMSTSTAPTCGTQQECYLDRKARFAVVAEYRRELQSLNERICSSAFPSPALLWAAGVFERAVSSLPGNERAHVLRFDAGRVHLERHDFEGAARQFASLSKCPSAPDRLRGFSSVFLAVAYLATAPKELLRGDSGREGDASALLRSVRVLLRCADRCLAVCDGGSCIEESCSTVGNAQLDPEVMCLRRRLQHHVKRDDSCLLLLPVEILYVFCYRFNGISRREENNSTGSQHTTGTSALGREQHARMLRYLDAIAWRFEPSSRSDVGPSTGVCQRVEWMLLRAIVLFNMWDSSLDDGSEAAASAQSQLHGLRALLVALGRQDAAVAELQRSFVVPVALFYELQLQLLTRPSKLDGITSSTANEGVGDDSDDLLWRWWRADRDGKPSEHAYAYQYDGKLRALRRLVAARASSSVGSCDSTSSDGSTP